MTSRQFTVAEILDELDRAEPYRSFLELGHPYLALIGARLHLFADETRWAMVGEKCGWNSHAGAITLDLSYFGNCLINQKFAGAFNQFVCNTHYFTLVTPEELDRIESKEEKERLKYNRVRPDVTEVFVHGKIVSIAHDQNAYAQHGIPVRPDAPVKFVELFRLLFAIHPIPFHAIVSELRTSLPSDIPHLLTLDQWHHRDFSIGRKNNLFGDLPSTYETYPMLADVLVSGDPIRYRPTLSPNTHWSFWPQSGSL